jgi:4-hydroxythreonine-4-phosphate dehydrogenase
MPRSLEGRPRLALASLEAGGGAGHPRRPRHSRVRIVLTMGDPAGIGPEVVLKALLAPGLREEFDLSVVGSRAVLEERARRLSLPFDADVAEAHDGPVPAEPGRPTPAGARAAVEAVVAAARACQSGAADAMVTAPVTKATIAEAGYDFPGHTEFLARLTGVESVVMTFVHGTRRIGLVTNHLPIAAVARTLTLELILDKLLILSRGLEESLGVPAPRIAVAALNPHAGERGTIGDEEERIIAPAVAAAREVGVAAEGPFPADSVFPRLGSCGEGGHPFDAALAMYHDQAMIPVRVWGIAGGVNLTLGLPIVRTSPDHGTALDLAGKGVADAGSMIAAVRLAGAVASRRASQRVRGD